MRPSQVAAFTASPGVSYTVTIEGQVVARNTSGKRQQYNENIILLYGTHMATITSYSCAFSFQRVPMAIAENMIRGYTLPSATLSSQAAKPNVSNMLSPSVMIYYLCKEYSQEIYGCAGLV